MLDFPQVIPGEKMKAMPCLLLISTAFALGAAVCVLLAISQQHSDRSPEGESSRVKFSSKARHSYHFLPRNNLGKIQHFYFLRVKSRVARMSDSQRC